jgi:fatty acid desaturase
MPPAAPAPALHGPALSWPALLLAAAAWGVWGGGAWLGVTGRAPAAVAVGVGALGAYLAFTPLHEAAHRAVAPRRRALNDWLGRLCAPLLLAPFAVFRHEHLQHHRHTNSPAQDPDAWSGRGPALLLPLRWATQDLHYYWRFPRALPLLTRGERAETAAAMALMLGAAGALLALGQGRALLLAWVLPARLAILVLAFAFDYLPHRPHRVTAAEDRYRATRVVDSPLLGVLLLSQNYHLVHHLYPAVPFHRYGRVWRAQEAQLRARGAKVTRLPL